MNRRIGIIGTGEIATSHAQAFGALGVNVVAYSRSESRRAAFRKAHGARTVKSFDALLAAADIIDICTPTDTHAGFALEAARAGRHVICEKPLARTLSQAQAMVAACDKVGVWLLPAHVVRYAPAYAAARDAVANGVIGSPRTLRLTRTVGFPEWATWFADVHRSGGVVVDLAIHDLDIARWIAGDVVEVHAETTTGEDGGAPQRATPRRATMWLTHASGVTSEVRATWDVPGTELRSTFDITGTAGAVAYDSGREPALGWLDVAEPAPVNLDRDPMVTQLEEFLEVIAGRAKPRVTADDGYAALAIALAAQQSAVSGRSVPL